MLSVEQAQSHIVAACRPLPAEVVALDAALGRVLAADVPARLTQPASDLSAMDGYAVRAEDARTAPATLRLAGRSVAGAGFTGRLAPGEAVRIFTGAPLPAGADAIVIQEHAQQQGESVVLRRAAEAGRHVRRTGQHFRQGEVLLQAGHRLTPRDLGLAASMNVPWLPVRRRPRVALLATGDELVLPGEPLDSDRITSSASIACAALLRASGAEPIVLGIARDCEDDLRRMLLAASGADLLLTIGGASVGELDLVRRVLDGLGLRLGFHRVAMRPGKPLLFGHLDDMPVLGLPGNPVSAYVTLLVFVRPAIAAMLGCVDPAGPLQMARLGGELAANDERQDYLRAARHHDAAGDPVVVPFAVQDSSMLRILAEATCLIVRPPRAPAAAQGDRVPVLSLD